MSSKQLQKALQFIERRRSQREASGGFPDTIGSTNKTKEIPLNGEASPIGAHLAIRVETNRRFLANKTAKQAVSDAFYSVKTQKHGPQVPSELENLLLYLDPVHELEVSAWAELSGVRKTHIKRYTTALQDAGLIIRVETDVYRRAADPAETDPRYVFEDSRMEEIIEWASTLSYVALDTETYGPEGQKDGALLYTKCTIRLLQVHSGDQTYIIDCDRVDEDNITDLLRTIRDSGCDLYLHNCIFDLPRLYRQFGILITDFVHDSMIASRVEAARPRTLHRLEAALLRYLDIQIPKSRRAWHRSLLTVDDLKYASDDVIHLYDLYSKIMEGIEKAELAEVYSNIQDTLPTWIEATVHGVPVEEGSLRSIQEALNREVEELETLLRATAPEQPEGLPWSWNNTQKDTTPHTGPGRNGAHRALELVGVEVKDLQERTLLSHVEDHPLVDVLAQYRKKGTQLSKYARWLTDFYDPQTGRLYPQPRIAGAITGRVTYGDPNIQGMDKKKTQEYRRCIKAKEGYAIVWGDFAQQEVRIAALFSEDKAMLKAFQRGEDVYAPLAKRLGSRAAAKTVFLGSMYGAGPKKYRQTVYRDTGELPSLEAAKAEQAEGRGAYPQYFEWQREFGSSAEWETRSVLGWRRVVDSDFFGNPKFTDRVNAPIQSTAGDILYLTLCKIAKDQSSVFSDAHAAHFLFGAHDELVLEAPTRQAENVARWLGQRMRDAMQEILGERLAGPKCVEVSYGPSWGEVVKMLTAEDIEENGAN
jgi:DNA polymerase I-like protein with 3'-5' exonuclease and polymerase domains